MIQQSLKLLIGMVLIFLFPIASVQAATSSRLTFPVASNATLVVENKDNTQSQTAIISDSLSSTKVILSSDGTTNVAPKYYPYGTSVSQLPQSPNNRYYTGQRKVTDVDSAIYNYNARYYSADSGIFTQPDSVEGINRFAYVGGNPVAKNDPSGHCTTCVSFNKKPGKYLDRIVQDFPNHGDVARVSANIVPMSPDQDTELDLGLLSNFSKQRSTVLETYFPVGKFGPYDSGSTWSTHFSDRSQAAIEFSAQFSENFDFGRGGKLHGLCNGPCPVGGGDTGEYGMNTRFMYGPEGELFLYVYDKNKLKGYQYGQYIPLLEGGPEIASNNNGSFNNVAHHKSFYAGFAEFYQGSADPLSEYKKVFATRGNWHILRMQVQLNDPGKQNGSIQAWMNGKRVANITSMDFIGNSKDPHALLDKAEFQTFAGGGDSSYAPKNDGTIRFGYFNVE